MIVKVDTSSTRQASWYEYALRFLIGGLICDAAALVAKSHGPNLGGLFLSFPAILPATATLIAAHERRKKAKKGLTGEARGRRAAAVDAAGAAMGSIGLAAFAWVGWQMVASYKAGFVLVAATAAWSIAAGLTWLVRKKRKRILAGARWWLNRDTR
jgi:hypothetical protein